VGQEKHFTPDVDALAEDFVEGLDQQGPLCEIETLQKALLDAPKAIHTTSQFQWFVGLFWGRVLETIAHPEDLQNTTCIIDQREISLMEGVAYGRMVAAEIRERQALSQSLKVVDHA
jgi:hypothetical protein